MLTVCDAQPEAHICSDFIFCLLLRRNDNKTVVQNDRPVFPWLKAWIRHSTRSCRVPSAHPRVLIDSNQDKSGGRRCNSASCDTAQIQCVVHISDVTDVKTARSWLSLVASLKHGGLGGYPFCCATRCAGRPVTLSLSPAGDNVLRHALLSCSWVITLKGVTRFASYLDAAVKQ